MLRPIVKMQERIVLHKSMTDAMIASGYDRVAIFEALRFKRHSKTAKEIRERALNEFYGVSVVEPKVEWLEV